MTWNNLLRFKRVFYLSAVLGALLSSGVVQAETHAEKLPPFVSDLMAAWQQNRLLPLLTQSCAPCDIEDAYYLQRLAVSEMSQGQWPAGFKAGLTTLAGQRKFGADGPVYGVLWPGSRITERQQSQGVMLDHWLRPMLEVELAFRFVDVPGLDRRDGRGEGRGLETKHIEVALAIELPDLAFSPGAVNAVDIVGANVAARRFLVAKPIRIEAWSQLRGAWRLSHNGAPSQQGVLNAIDHEVALLHLLDHIEAQAYRLQPGQWLLTGALAGMKPAQRGRYTLSAEGLPDLSLRIR